MRTYHYKNPTAFLLTSFVLLSLYNRCVEAVAPKVTLTSISRPVHQYGHGLHCAKQENVAQSPDNSPLVQNLEENHIFNFEGNVSSIEITCTAPYRVTWTHSQDKWVNRATNEEIWGLPIFYEKIKTNATQFNFSATLAIYRQRIRLNHGEYTCRKVPSEKNGGDDTSVRIKVFTENPGTRYVFPLSGTNITLWKKERKDGSVIFPCYVYNLHANVTLYKLASGEKWDPITTGFTFKPELGFYFSGAAATDLSPGTYICSEYNNTTETIKIILEEGERPEVLKISQTITAPANFTVDFSATSSEVRISCCSNSSTPPKMVLSECDDDNSCRNQERLVSNLLSIPEIYSDHITEGNCDVTPMMSLQGLNPLNIFCVGDGVSVRKTVIGPLFQDSYTITDKSDLKYTDVPPYTSWEDVDPLVFMLIYEDKAFADYDDTGKMILYGSENVTFDCHTAPHVYAAGAWMTINYHNASSVRIEETNKVWGGTATALYNYFTFQLSTSIQSITCHAPLLSSDKWISKTVEVVVKEKGVPPEILGSDTIEEVVWKENDRDRILTCEFNGHPLPHSRVWTRNNETLHNGYDGFAIETPSRNKSSLKVGEAHFSDGIYKFIATNQFGESSKTFHVVLKEKK